MKMETPKAPPRVSVDLSPQLSSRLDELAGSHGMSKIEIMRRAFALYDVAMKAHDNKQRVGVFDTEGKLVKEFVGLV